MGPDRRHLGEIGRGSSHTINPWILVMEGRATIAAEGTNNVQTNDIWRDRGQPRVLPR
jgi:hypothetical protein